MGILDQLVSISEEFVWQAPFNPQLHFRREYDCDRLLPDIGRRLVGVSFCAAPRRRQEHVSRRGAAPGWLVFVIMARPSNYPPSRHLLLERSHSQLTLSVPMQHMAGLAGPRRCREWLRSRCRRLQPGEDQPQRANARRHRERVAGDDPLQLRDRRRCLAIIKFYGSHGCFVERRWPPLWTGIRRLHLSS